MSDALSGELLIDGSHEEGSGVVVPDASVAVINIRGHARPLDYLGLGLIQIGLHVPHKLVPRQVENPQQQDQATRRQPLFASLNPRYGQLRDFERLRNL